MTRDHVEIGMVDTLLNNLEIIRSAWSERMTQGAEKGSPMTLEQVLDFE